VFLSVPEQVWTNIRLEVAGVRIFYSGVQQIASPPKPADFMMPGRMRASFQLKEATP